MARIGFFICTLLLSFVSLAQNCKVGIDTFPNLHKNFRKTANWIQAESNRIYYYAKYSRQMDIYGATKSIRLDKDFWTFLQAKTWCIDNFKSSVPILIEMLTDTTKVGLENTGDLIIWDRVQSKELKFYGHGAIIMEDIFTIAGRCSHILNELTGENFALVHMTTTTAELKTYQKLWRSWFKQF
jgi:hypothetical protein